MKERLIYGLLFWFFATIILGITDNYVGIFNGNVGIFMLVCSLIGAVGMIMIPASKR